MLVIVITPAKIHSGREVSLQDQQTKAKALTLGCFSAGRRLEPNDRNYYNCGHAPGQLE
jgi:hypothetical protein